MKCPECQGSGRIPCDEGNAGPKYKDCPRCKGTGQVTSQIIHEAVCPNCGGAGRIMTGGGGTCTPEFDTCPQCNGHCKILVDEKGYPV